MCSFATSSETNVEIWRMFCGSLFAAIARLLVVVHMCVIRGRHYLPNSVVVDMCTVRRRLCLPDVVDVCVIRWVCRGVSRDDVIMIGFR